MLDFSYELHLALGRLELDWGKNNGFSDHSAPFQEGDVADVPHYYSGDELSESELDGRRWEVIAQLKEGLSMPLPQVVDRLNLLGYSQTCAEKNSST